MSLSECAAVSCSRSQERYLFAARRFLDEVLSPDIRRSVITVHEARSDHESERFSLLVTTCMLSNHAEVLGIQVARTLDEGRFP